MSEQECTCGDPGRYHCERHDALGGIEEVRGPDWVPAGSEDAGLVLSADERRMLICFCLAVELVGHERGCTVPVVERIVAARVEAARVEERERIAAAIEARRAEWTSYPGGARALADAARVARTPPPAGDAQGGAK